MTAKPSKNTDLDKIYHYMYLIIKHDLYIQAEIEKILRFSVDRQIYLNYNH